MSYKHVVSEHTNVSELFAVVKAHPEGVIFCSGATKEDGSPKYTKGAAIVEKNPGEGQIVATQSVLNNLAWKLNDVNGVIGTRTASTDAPKTGDAPAKTSTPRKTGTKNVVIGQKIAKAEFNLDNGTVELDFSNAGRDEGAHCVFDVESESITVPLSALRYHSNQLYQFAFGVLRSLSDAVEIRDGAEVKPGFCIRGEQGEILYASEKTDKIAAGLEILGAAAAKQDVAFLMANAAGLSTGTCTLMVPTGDGLKAEFMDKFEIATKFAVKIEEPVKPVEKPASETPPTAEQIEAAKAAGTIVEGMAAPASVSEPAPAEATAIPVTAEPAKEPEMAEAAPAAPAAKGKLKK